MYMYIHIHIIYIYIYIYPELTPAHVERVCACICAQRAEWYQHPHRTSKRDLVTHREQNGTNTRV